MATYNETQGGTVGYPSLNPSPDGRIERVIDLSKVNGGAGTVAADIIQALPIPAGTFVRGIYIKPLTVSANLASVNVGDGADPDGYLAAANLTQAALKASFGGATAFAAGKFYAAADTIDITQVTAVTSVTGVIVVGAIVTDCNNQITQLPAS